MFFSFTTSLPSSFFLLTATAPPPPFFNPLSHYQTDLEMMKKKSSAIAAGATSTSAAAKATADASKRSVLEVSAAAPAPGDWPASTMTKHEDKKARSLGLIFPDEGNIILPSRFVLRAPILLPVLL
jgi:hypothetical protein